MDTDALVPLVHGRAGIDVRYRPAYDAYRAAVRPDRRAAAVVA